MTTEEFQEHIWQKGNELYRDMPWRTDTRPYYVLVSELMLQQTQVDRVIPKFQAFIQAFPTTKALAAASLAEVLALWSGLGYNRRAKYLWESAKLIENEYAGVFPQTVEGLKKLPGVGVNTAGAIAAYSFNLPVVYVETNVRTVFFYHFFEHEEGVADAAVQEKVAETIDAEHPREWYWALMDYGAFLKRQGGGLNTKSAHYKKQAPLKGSVREVRGQIIKQLTRGACEEAALREHLRADDRFEPALQGLEKEGLVARTKGQLHLQR